MRIRRNRRPAAPTADAFLSQIAKARFYLHQGDADAVDDALNRLEAYSRSLPNDSDSYANLANALHGTRF